MMNQREWMRELGKSLTEEEKDLLARPVKCPTCGSPVVNAPYPKGLWCPQCLASLDITVEMTQQLFRKSIEGTSYAETYDRMRDRLKRTTPHNEQEIENLLANSIYKIMKEKMAELEVKRNARKDKPFQPE